MSRRSRAQVKVADPVYNSRLVTLLIDQILESGKKSLAQRLVGNALEKIHQETGENPVLLLEKAVKNVSPSAGIRVRRRRGSKCKIPFPVKGYKSTNFALKWIKANASTRPGRSFSAKLAKEILDASEGTGKSVRQKQQQHKVARANKAFAYLRFKG
jgi:small subunit ribosomal protein S7